MARPAAAAVRLLTGEREPVRLATTVDIGLSGLQRIDGTMTEVGDRVLVKDQADSTRNGIYTASAGSWFRAADARTSREMQKGTTVHVQLGAVNADRVFSFVAEAPVVGTDQIAIAPFLPPDLNGAVEDAEAAAENAAASATQAAASAAAAGISAGQTAADVVATHADVAATAVNLANAQLASAASGVYPNAYTTSLPKGVTGTTGLVGGAGGANGTFALGFAGGSITGMAGTFTVAGGAVTAINITSPGLGSGTTPPTLSFTASAGLTGASATAVVGNLIAAQKTYWALSTDGAYLQLYQNDGTATPAVVTKATLTAKAMTDLMALQLGLPFSATRLTVASGSVTPTCYRSYAFANATTYEHVVRAKADGLRFGQLICNLAGAAYTVNFDIVNGLVSGQSGANLVSASIVALGSGVFDLKVRLTTTGTGSANVQFRPSLAAGTFPFTGDGVAGIFVQFMELRDGATGQNLFPSNDPADASFTKTGLTATAGQTMPASSAIPPLQSSVASLDQLVNGKVIAAKLAEGTGTNVDVRLYRTLTTKLGSIYEFGIDSSRLGKSRVALFSNAGVAFNSVFDLKTGSGAGTGSPAVKVLGNGWESCSVSAVASAAATTNLQIRVYPDIGGPTYSPTGADALGLARAWLKEDGVLIWEDWDFSAWTKNNLTVSQNALLYIGALANPAAPYDNGAAKLKGKKVVFLGTSITIGGNYTSPLAILAGFSATNLGVSGASIGQNSHYGSLGIYNQIPNIPTDTEIVFIEAGTNDFGAGANSAENTPLGVLGDSTTASFYGALYAAVVAIRARATNAVIIFLSPYSSTSAFPSHAIGTTNYRGNTLVQFQQAVEDVAKYTGYPLIDVGRRSRLGYFMPSDWTSDGLHIIAIGGAVHAAYDYEQLLALARAGLFG